MPATSTSVSANAAAKLPKGASLIVPVAIDGKASSVDADLATLGEEIAHAAKQLVTDGLATGKAGSAAPGLAGKTKLLLIGTGKKP
ncbi:MAG: hypothetical protein AAF561_16870, partial [Planctomycetota bacterium]